MRVRSLPAKFNPTGTYTDRIFDRTRGFRLLAHAEIEACLEDLGVATVNAAYSAWSQDGRARTTLVALMTFSDRTGKGAPTELQRKGGGDLRQRLLEVRNDYVRWARIENHGIREKNVLRLLLPAGIREHDIDPAWLSTIDTFGSNRGATAHGAGRPQTPPDPAQELETVKAIVNGLIPLDQHLSALQQE